MNEPPLSLEVEAGRIEDLARRNIAEGRAALNALLDRPRRLTGAEFAEALTFNARLCTLLRDRDQARLSSRRLRLWEEERGRGSSCE